MEISDRKDDLPILSQVAIAIAALFCVYILSSLWTVAMHMGGRMGYAWWGKYSGELLVFSLIYIFLSLVGFVASRLKPLLQITSLATVSLAAIVFWVVRTSVLRRQLAVEAAKDVILSKNDLLLSLVSIFGFFFLGMLGVFAVMIAMRLRGAESKGMRFPLLALILLSLGGIVETFARILSFSWMM